MTSTKPPTVAVIGCGPTGMFLLRALAARRAKLEEEGDAEGLAALPVVTCFERSSGPGGVWRSDRFRGEGEDDGATNMYEALWTNGPKEAMEFFDYTYLEHFGRAMPTFLPRGLVLEYFLARCTKNNPDLFDDVKFNTSVEHVEYDEETDKFLVDLSDGTKDSFDLCVWAAGINGRPNIPPSIDAMLTSGGFKGKMMHSAQTDSNFDQHVRGKNVMMIGDEYSAEDLALQAIKLGAERIDVVTRGCQGVAYTTESWPMDRVTVHGPCVAAGVADDGRGIVLSRVQWDYDKKEYATLSGEQITLDDVDTVICCTGYKPNFDMLDKNLRPDMRAHFAMSQASIDSWRMSSNPLTEDLGDVPLADEILPEPEIVRPDMYRGRLISNPKMFVVYEVYDAPLLNLDIAAWLMVAQMTGDLPVPTADEMRRFNRETLLDCLNDPFFRYNSDGNYEERWKTLCNDNEDHWSNDNWSPRTEAMHRGYHDLEHRLLARDAMDAGYPLDLGTYEELNDKGKALVAINLDVEYSRYEVDTSEPDAANMTFRDCDPSACRSIFTGTVSVPLKGRWLELEGCELKDIVGDPSELDEECSADDCSVTSEDCSVTSEDCSVTSVSGSPPTESLPTVLVKEVAKVHKERQDDEPAKVGEEVAKPHEERQDDEVVEDGPSDRTPNSPAVPHHKSVRGPSGAEVVA